MLLFRDGGGLPGGGGRQREVGCIPWAESSGPGGLWGGGEVQFPLSLAEMFIFLLQNKSW